MFYEKFIRLCQLKGVSPSHVATQIGVHTSTVSDRSRGAKPRTQTMLKLADYFGVDVTEFTSNVEEEPKIKMIPVQVITEEDSRIISMLHGLPDTVRDDVYTMIEAIATKYLDLGAKK